MDVSIWTKWSAGVGNVSRTTTTIPTWRTKSRSTDDRVRSIGLSGIMPVDRVRLRRRMLDVVSFQRDFIDLNVYIFVVFSSLFVFFRHIFVSTVSTGSKLNIRCMRKQTV
jgi:hypothetical protein